MKRKCSNTIKINNMNYKATNHDKENAGKDRNLVDMTGGGRRLWGPDGLGEGELVQRN